MHKNPKISVVMLCWNRKSEVRNSLHHLFQSDYSNFEAIVIDNGSSDGTDDLIKLEFPEVRYVRLQQNIGVAGYNYGFKVARGQYILILDDDSYPDSSTLSRGAIAFDTASPEVAIITCNILNPLRNNYDSTRDWPKEMITFWGCGAFIRSELIEKFGGYQEDFFLYRNELELSLRLISNGYKIIYSPELVIYHRVSPVNRTNKRAFRYTNRNDIYIITRYFRSPSKYNYLLKIFILTFIKSCTKYTLKDFLFIWKGIGKLLKDDQIQFNDNFHSFINQSIWREKDLLPFKLTDIPARLIKNKTIY